MAEQPASERPNGTVAYVLKGYPRLSETFIASEIHRVEQAGVPLRLYVIKPVEAWEEGPRHPVVDRIRARPQYLPGTTPLKEPLYRWLPRNLPAFWPSVRRVAARHPRGVARAAGAAFAQAVRARRKFFGAPRKLYVKEFLQAAALADRLLDAPDVRHMHAHFAHGATTVTWLASKMLGLPFSFTGHARDIYAESQNPAGLLRRKLLAAQFAVTCTQANVEYLRGIEPTARIHRVYHGLTSDIAAGLQDGAGESQRNGGFRVLGVGRLVRKKGFDVMVEACALMARDGVEFDAVLVGQEGDASDAVRAGIEAHGLRDRVRLVGAMTQDQLIGEYARADAMCLPCRLLDADRDGIPNVLVEAMACGVPVVTTDVSGIPELVSDGDNGLLVSPDDPVALAAALTRLHGDRALARRLGEAGRSTVAERFDGDRLARTLADLFTQGPR